MQKTSTWLARHRALACTDDMVERMVSPHHLDLHHFVLFIASDPISSSRQSGSLCLLGSATDKTMHFPGRGQQKERKDKVSHVYRSPATKAVARALFYRPALLYMKTAGKTGETRVCIKTVAVKQNMVLKIIKVRGVHVRRCAACHVNCT